MTWVKIDDQFHGHPKVQRAWHADPAAIGLHLLALSHAGAYLTDGHVPETFVKTQVPSPARRRRAVAALVDAGLWEAVAGGWQIHDFLDFNESRQAALARRAQGSEARSAAGRKGASRRWTPDSSTNGKPSEILCSPYGERMAPAADGKPMAPAPAPYPFP